MSHFTSTENYWYFFRHIIYNPDADIVITFPKKSLSTDAEKYAVSSCSRNQDSMSPACVLNLGSEIPEIPSNIGLLLGYKVNSHNFNYIDLRPANTKDWKYKGRIVIYPILDHIAWQF